MKIDFSNIPIYGKWQNLVFVPLIGILIGFLFFFISKDQEGFTVIQFLYHSILSTVIIWVGCMTIVVYLWKKFPWEFHPIKHIVLEVLLIVVYLLITHWSFASVFNYETNGCNAVSRNADYTITYLITFLITAIHEGVFFYKQWKDNFSKSIRLERDNLEARYNTLKTQINPHFLFNSLNSLISLVDDNPKAEKYIQDLAEFFRYVLISSERELVKMEEEWRFTQKYINLQQLRFSENFVVEQSLGDAVLHTDVPPLVLQILLENCVKHNIISKAQPLLVSIYNDDEYVYIKNNHQSKQSLSSTGHGLKNIEGRYQFLTDREVKVINRDDAFIVALPILSVE